ncbi:hypothetical protein [Chryseobacterium sp. Leaf394]|uniref:hypothetical protein n=1 Tax=Chryseobacterium sp. Leaf394 TaxID=1736361 RepID=UPI000700CD0D|nr:hypothetical protein [Chryseobacterium sp. Leaf394]KQS92951.1 hypothetical protein ASG21_11090 [Chryseobacterium sp. Leaf394]
MQINIKILWIFYRKILIPAVLFSLLTTLPQGLNFKNFSLGFLFIFPLMHYFIYELRLKNEYLFYANFGFSRRQLWILTLIFAVSLKLIATFI